MKKFNYFLLGLAGLAMASCSQEDLVGPATGDGNFNVTVQLPADLTTRAVNMNTGLTAEDLYYAVYDASDGKLVMNGQTTFGGSLKTVVSFNLANAKSYNISFFASAPKNGVYNFDAENKVMTVDYEAMTSIGTEQEDLYDCFINLLPTGPIGSETVNTSVTLYRPIAQINWGTDDLGYEAVGAAFGTGGEFLESTLITQAYNTFSLLDNDVVMTSDKADLLPSTNNGKFMVPVTLEKFGQPKTAGGTTAIFPVDGYEYVTMQYVLAPNVSSAVYNLDLAISNSGNQNPEAESNPEVVTHNVTVDNAPVQANFRTNIYGNLLTDNVQITVDKDPDWYIPDYDFELINGVKYLVVNPDSPLLLRNGGNLILSGDVTFDSATEDSYFIINKNTNLNLNGYTVSSNLPGLYDATIAVGGSATDVTISNGTVAPLENDEPATSTTSGSSNIYFVPSTASTLTLNNITAIGSHPVWMNVKPGGENAVLIINSGTYASTYSNQEAVYVSKGGKIFINGGTFGKEGVNPGYCLNVKGDLLTNGKTSRDFIEVFGGTFINFNPADNAADGAGTNYVADGYTVVASTMGDDTYYTVVPESSTITVSNQTELQGAVGTPNTTVVLKGGEYYTYPNKVASGVTFVGMEGAAFYMGKSYQAGYTNVTFKNLKFISTNENYYGLQHSANLKYENCEIEGLIWLYAQGIEFENCKFTQPLANNYNVWTYTATPVTFTNCSFSCAGKSVLIYNEQVGKKNVCAVTFENCDFTASQPASDGKAAIEIGDGNSFVVYINNCTAKGFDKGSLSGESLWNHKTTNNDVRVFVNGEEVYYNY